MAKDDPERMTRRALEDEVRRLRHLLTRHMSRGAELWFESGVNNEGQPFVQMHWGDEAGQLDTDRARTHGLSVIEVACAADHDAALWRAVTGPMGLEPEAVAALLGMMREQRGGEREASAEGT